MLRSFFSLVHFLSSPNRRQVLNFILCTENVAINYVIKWNFLIALFSVCHAGVMCGGWDIKRETSELQSVYSVLGIAITYLNV